jgi:hypothetical protein
VVVPLLLVGDKGDGDQTDEQARDGDLDSVHGWVETRVHEEKVGRGGYGEEEDLKKVLAGVKMK